MSGEPLFSVTGLRVELETEAGVVPAVDGASFAVEAGRALAIVGDAGAGKTMTLLAALGLIDHPDVRIGGEVRFDGTDLLSLDRELLRRLRGDAIAIVLSERDGSLHPRRTVGDQAAEAIRAHRPVSAPAARDRAIDLLERVGIPDPHRLVDDYPHQLSAVLRRRAMIAMALAGEPRLLIVDEPAAALDLTDQTKILALLGELGRSDLTMVLATRELGLAAQLADEVAIMRAGRIVEEASTERLLAAPQHPYTQALLRAIPRLDRPRGEPLVEIRS
jgi:peptide/nickel transport system ATP-binding protein